MSPEVRSVLEDARQKIADGWCQGAYSCINEHGEVSYCLVGALRQSSPLLDLEVKAVEALLRAINHGKPWATVFSIPSWNDVPGRTKEEVLDVIARALGQTAERGDLQ